MILFVCINCGVKLNFEEVLGLACKNMLVFQDDSSAVTGISSTAASVNRYIQQLAQEYCGDCKTSFDELSKIIQVTKNYRFAQHIYD